MDAFIARQPILDRDLRVYGYELLFRSGFENAVGQPDLNYASTKVLSDSFLLYGMKALTQGRRAFINVTEHVLVNDYMQLFPRDETVVELIELLEPTPWVLDACQRLKRSGYVIALDDYVGDGSGGGLLELADIVKIDVLETPAPDRERLARRFAGNGKKLVAEKVETQEMFQETLALGYDLFQGYFFSRPKVIAAQDVPGHKLRYFEVLKEIHRPEMDFDRLETIIKREVSLCYKLLRYLNSASFGWRTRIDSVRRALVLLGETEFKRWASFIIMASMAREKPEELLVQSVVRGRLCESLAPRVGLAERSQDLFLMGMFSLIDAILDRPLGELLAELPIADDVKEALLGGEGELSRILQYAVSYERGEWCGLEQAIALLKDAGENAPRLFVDAVEWGSSSVGSAET